MENVIPILTRLIPTLSIFAVVLLLEAIIPLRKRVRGVLGRVPTNLAFMAITLGLGMLLNGLLAVVALYVGDHGGGLFGLLHISGATGFVLAILLLDIAIYMAHVFLHSVPLFWRMHLVHHMDVHVDVTTAYRQHPLEGILRFAVMAFAVLCFGLPAEAVALYRLMGSINSAVEHGNIRLPSWVERILISFWVTPDMHKVHHSRERRETDSNFANLFSFIDRLFGTFTPTACVSTLKYGIDGFDHPKQHTAGAVLSLPFRAEAGGRVRSVTQEPLHGI